MAGRDGLREAPRRPGPAPSRVHPGPLGRAQPDRQPLAVPGLDGPRPGRPDADPVVVHRARRDRRHAGQPHRPADAVQLLPHRRRQRRPQPRLHEPPGRLDEPRDRADRIRHDAAQRERDLRAPDARPRHHRHRHGAAHGHDRPEPARDRRAVRCPAGASVQRLSGARLRHPDPQRGRLPRPLPAADGRDPPEPADHRPVPPPDARRADLAKLPRLLRPRPGRAYAGIEGPRGQYAAYASATARTSRSGCASTTRRSSTSRRSA